MLEGYSIVKKDTSINLEKLEEEIKSNPGKMQWALYWVITNIDLAIKICEASYITPDDLECKIENALNKKDYILYILLLLYKHIKSEN